MESYSRAGELDPQCRDAFQNLGNVSSRIAHSVAADAETQQRFYRMSEEAYDRAIAIAPDSAELYYCKGNLFTKQLRLAEALELTEKALGMKPDFTEAWYAKGYLLMEMERSTEALAAYAQAAACDPRSRFHCQSLDQLRQHPCGTRHA